MHRRDEWAQIVATVEAARADVERDWIAWEKEVAS
jgi:hypothetical protein